MTEPTVACVMLTRDRPAMARRAIKSFRQQTYTPRMLLIWDTSTAECIDQTIFQDDEFDEPETCSAPRGYVLWYPETNTHKTIGQLRNDANCHAVEEMGAEIICTWDSDDRSHPNRIAEQVALLQASGAECVGYNEALFWDTRPCQAPGPIREQLYLDGKPIASPQDLGHWDRSYIYRCYDPGYAIGSSLMYLRSAWERVKFDHISHGEDQRFVRKVKTVGVTGFPPTYNMVQMPEGYMKPLTVTPCDEPRMICSIHGGNSAPYNPEREKNSYTRSPQWDAYCEREMKL